MIVMKIKKDKQQIFKEEKPRYNPFQTGYGFQKVKKYDRKEEIDKYKKGKYE